jgi:pyrimidine-nucleoside phosphorylase
LRGDPRVVDDPSLLPQAPRKIDVHVLSGGVVQSVDTEAVGIASMMLGGGRKQASDKVDPRVGIEVHKRIGDRVATGEPLVTLHAADIGVDDATALVQRAFVTGDAQVKAPELFVERITGGTP